LQRQLSHSGVIAITFSEQPFLILGGLAQPMYFVQSTTNWMPHPWQFHGWAAMPRGSGDFADVKLRFFGLVDENRSAFATGVVPEAAP
jgi:hypothetical protein